MNIIVVGCGRVGSALAYQLYRKGYQVTVVDREASAFNNLPSDFGGRMEEGDVLSREVLHRAGIEQADAVATVTSSDSINAVVAHVARTAYHVPNVVVRNYDARWRPLHETFGLQVVSPASWGVQRMEELLFGTPLRVVYSAGNAEVEIYELVVPEKWHGRSLPELLPEGQCLTVALTRAGRAMLPSCDVRLEAGDVVYLSATLEGIEALRRRLDLGQEG